MEQSELFKNILDNNIKIVELTVKCETFDSKYLNRLRDATGNSILHTAVSRHCDPEIIFLLLDFVNPAIRNEEGLQMQDLFKGNPRKMEYLTVFKKFIAAKINDGDSHIITNWVLQGWSFKLLLEEVIDDLYDIVNEDLDGFLSYLCKLSNTVKELHHAAVQGEIEGTKTILAAQRNSEEQDRLITAWDDSGETILHKLVICEQETILKEILENFPNCVNATDHMDRTALHLAAALENPHYDIYEMLELHGGDPTLRDIKDLAPIDYRSKKSLIDMKMLKHSVVESLAYSISENSSKPFIKSNYDTDCNFEHTESQYIEQKLSQPLIKALALVVEKKPADPIEFLAIYLIRHNSSIKPNVSVPSLEQKSANEEHEQEFTISPNIFRLNRVEERDSSGRTRIHEHVLRGGAHFFGLVAENCNFALRDKEGKTAKHLAIERDQKDAVKELDALVNNIVHEGNAATLELLIIMGYSECFPKFTEEFGPDLYGVNENVSEMISNIPNICSNIDQARTAVNDNEPQSRLEELITNKVTALAYDNRGLSLIHRAIQVRNINAMRHLLKLFPECCQLYDSLNRLPLHFAEAIGGQIRSECLQLSAGHGENSVDALGHTPGYYRDNPSEILQ